MPLSSTKNPRWSGAGCGAPEPGLRPVPPGARCGRPWAGAAHSPPARASQRLSAGKSEDPGMGRRANQPATVDPIRDARRPPRRRSPAPGPARERRRPADWPPGRGRRQEGRARSSSTRSPGRRLQAGRSRPSRRRIPTSRSSTRACTRRNFAPAHPPGAPGEPLHVGRGDDPDKHGTAGAAPRRGYGTPCGRRSSCRR